MLMADHGGEPASLFAAVPDDKLAKLASTACRMFGIIGQVESFDAEFMVEPLCVHLADRLQRSGMSAAAQLAGASEASKGRPTELARALRVVTQLSRLAVGSTSGNARSEPSEDVNACRRAAERIGASGQVREAVLALGRLAVAGQADAADHTLPELRESVRALELGDLGAELAILLHQEKLTAQPSGKQMSTSAQSVWTAIYEMRSILQRARVRQFDTVVPEGVQLSELIDGVSCGKLSVQLLMGSSVGGSAGAQARLHQLLRAWPLLIALVREVHPGDEQAEMTLLQLGKTAFDGAARTRPDGALAYLASIFERMEKRYHAEYLRGFQSEHSWASVVAHQEEKNAKAHATSQLMGAAVSAADKSKAQRERERQAAEKAAAAEKEKGGVAAPAVPEPEPEAAAPASPNGKGAEK